MVRDRDKADRSGDRKGSLGKRTHEGNRAADASQNLLHFRMMVAVKKAGSVIGKASCPGLACTAEMLLFELRLKAVLPTWVCREEISFR